MSPLSTAELLAEVPDELVFQFRAQFYEQFRKEIQGTVFDKRDVDDMLDEPRIRMYLALADHDLKVALKNTRDMFIWRNDFKVRDIQLSDFPPTLLRGAMFFRNKDTDGNNIFWFRVHFLKKGQLSVEKKKFFAYLLEQHYQKFKGERVTFVFDMTDTGLTQADLDVLRFQISCFQHNFPFIVNNLLVYRLPWVLEGIWKIVKTWLSPKSVEKVKFVSSEQTIEPFISRENRFTHFGDGADRFADAHGEGDSVFLGYSDLYCGTPRLLGHHNASFSSVKMAVENAESTDTLTMQTGNGHALLASRSGSIVSTPPGSPLILVEQGSEAAGLDLSATATSTPKRPSPKPTTTITTIQRSVSSSDETLLEFLPERTIVFDKTSTSAEIIEASIYLKNISSGIVAFKVKSTSMTRYRSRPCAGFIQPNHVRHVHISCRFADRGCLSSDRFLIQYTLVQEENVDATVPPATAASKILCTKNGEKMFEKRLIPTASPTLPPVVMNGNAVTDGGDIKCNNNNNNATPTPPLLPNSDDEQQQQAKSSSSSNCCAEIASNYKELSEKLLKELANQRRYIHFMAVVVSLQMLLFFVYFFVFQIPEKFRDFNSNDLKSSSCQASYPDL